LHYNITIVLKLKNEIWNIGRYTYQTMNIHKLVNECEKNFFLTAPLLGWCLINLEYKNNFYLVHRVYLWLKISGSSTPVHIPNGVESHDILVPPTAYMSSLCAIMYNNIIIYPLSRDDDCWQVTTMFIYPLIAVVHRLTII